MKSFASRSESVMLWISNFFISLEVIRENLQKKTTKKCSENSQYAAIPIVSKNCINIKFAIRALVRSCKN